MESSRRIRTARPTAKASGSLNALQSKFETILRHVQGARKIVDRQRRLVTDKMAAGRDTATAEQLLDQFERTLAIFEKELADAQKVSNCPVVGDLPSPS
jgi:hypothetical protein